jgi:hypothetical protein
MRARYIRAKYWLLSNSDRVEALGRWFFVIWPFFWLTALLAVWAVVVYDGIYWFLGHDKEKASNLIVLIGGALGIPIAVWRGYQLHRQASTQAKNLKQSLHIARSDERFKRKQLAMDQLASEKAVVRNAGVVGLIAAMEDPDEDDPEALAALLSAYIRRARPLLLEGIEEEHEPNSLDALGGESPKPPSP